MGKGQLEAVGLGAHFVNFEWHLAGPAYAFKIVGLTSACSPTAIRSAGENHPALVEAHPNQSAFEPAQEVERGTLPNAVHLLQKAALDLGMRLFPHKNLSRKGAKLSVGVIQNDSGW